MDDHYRSVILRWINRYQRIMTFHSSLNSPLPKSLQHQSVSQQDSETDIYGKPDEDQDEDDEPGKGQGVGQSWARAIVVE